MNDPSVRDPLQSLRPETLAAPHFGLWLDRYIPRFGAAGGPGEHIETALQTLRVPPLYESFYRRWEQSTPEPGTVSAKATVCNRMVVGLGGESVLETSIALHRTYGVPYIPGSALKGLAASAARRRTVQGDDWHPGGPAFQIVFGILDDAGFVTFHDALWVPAGSDLPQVRDVMTVHHADYYQGKPVPPADWDDPNPVAFLTANGTYRLALSGRREWAEAAMDWLAIGLREDGIGAKTAAGYGRLKVEWELRHISLRTAPSSTGAGGGAAGAGRPSSGPIHIPWQPRVSALSPGSAEATIVGLLKEYQGDELREMAQAAVKKLDRKWLNDPKRQDKEWVKALLAAANCTS